MKTYILKLKTTSTTNYNLYDGATLVSDSDLATLFGSAGSAYFTFDFNEGTPTDTTSLTILNSEDTAVMANTGLEGIAEDRNFKGVWADSATAFTAFTLLKGVAMDEAELTTLVGMVKNASGVKPLTTADYNYHATGNVDDCVALWKLETGLYVAGEQMFWAYPGSQKMTILQGSSVLIERGAANTTAIITPADDSEFPKLWVMRNNGNGAVPFPTNTFSQPFLLDSNKVINSLTSSLTAQPLSANQGRVLNSLIGAKADKTAFTGTDGTAAGTAGLVPAPATTDAGKVLSASGTWTGLPEGVKTLTNADYNYPATNPNKIALWLLEPGIYRIKPGDAFADVTIRKWADNSTINGVARETTIGASSGHRSYGEAIVFVESAYLSSDTPYRRLLIIGPYADVETIGAVNLSTGNIAGDSAYEPTKMLLGINCVDALNSSNTLVPLSANQGRILNGKIVGTTETATIATTDWAALTDSDPYDYSATITATATIDANTGVVELLNDQPALFGTYGFAIGVVSGQSVTIYSIGQPDASVSLKLNIRNL